MKTDRAMSRNENGGFSYTAPYTESHVAADLAIKAMLFIELMCDQTEKNKSYGELMSTKQSLARFGFTNSQNAKLLGEMQTQMEDYKKASDTLAFMEDVWQKFGKEAMVVRYDHFFEILEKYDMVCGSFNRYTGAIPQSAIDTLDRLNDMWERKELTNKYAVGLTYAKVYSFTDETTGLDILRKCMRLPLRCANKGIMREISNVCGLDLGVNEEDKRKRLSDVMFITAPAADMKPLKMKVEFDTPQMRNIHEKRIRLINEFSLSRLSAQAFLEEYSEQRNHLGYEDDKLTKQFDAEVDRLKAIVEASDINRYAKIDFVKTKPTPLRLLLDPFICSLTRYGVLIHAKWGAEAEDATIKRYEELHDAVLKGGTQ